MYVTDLELEDLRCISRTRIPLLHPDHSDATSFEFPNLNVLVGLNGGGKSTFLKGVGLALVGRDLAALKRSWDSWPRKGGSGECRAQADMIVHPDDLGDEADVAPGQRYRSQRSVRIGRDDGSLDPHTPAVADGSGALRAPEFFMVAYGAGREVAAPEAAMRPGDDMDPSVSGISNLLFGGPPLTPLEAWLDVEHSRFAEVVALVDSLLPSDTRFEGEREEAGFRFVNRGVPVTREALSDGVQGYLAWMTDLVHRLTEAAAPEAALVDVVGVVMVDEIDQRMHPRWQQNVLARLGGTLPRLQFILTSHSPLVAGGLRAENLILLEEDPDATGVGATRARRLKEDVYGATADQVLTSSYFSLEMSRTQGFHSILRQLARDGRDGERPALEFMRKLTSTARPGGQAELRRSPLKPDPNAPDEAEPAG